MADWLKKVEEKLPAKDSEEAKIIKIVLIVLACLIVAAGIAFLAYKLVLKFQKDGDCGSYEESDEEDDFFEGEEE